MLKKFIPIVALLYLSACTGGGLFLANFPAFFSPQKITRDIDFGSDYGSKLDVYVPDTKKPTCPSSSFSTAAPGKPDQKVITASSPMHLPHSATSS